MAATKDEAIHDIEEECFDIMYKKNQDYGDNISRHGAEGVIIRLWDKLYRLDNVFHSGTREVIDETLEDTIKDARNYLTILLLLLRNEWQLPWHTKHDTHCPPHDWHKYTQSGPYVCSLCGIYKKQYDLWMSVKDKEGDESWTLGWGSEQGPSEVDG